MNCGTGVRTTALLGSLLIVTAGCAELVGTVESERLDVPSAASPSSSTAASSADTGSVFIDVSSGAELPSVASVAPSVTASVDGEHQAPPGGTVAPTEPEQPVACLPVNPFTTRRLTRYELLGVLSSVLGAEVLASDDVATAIASFPEEASGDITRDFQDTHTLQHVTSMLAISEAVAHVLEANLEQREQVFGQCVEAADEECARAFFDTVGARLLRRPIDAARKSAWLDAFEADGQGALGMVRMLQRALQAPELAFHLWSQNDAYVAASRLSFALTGAGPDEELLADAAAGKLQHRSVLEAHALRLADSPPGRQTFERLLDDWLGLRTAPNANAVVAAHANIDASGLAQEAHRELLDFAGYAVFDALASSSELLTLDIGFPKSERLAKIYGSEIASDDPVVLPNGHRGLMLRAAPLISGHTHTSPILRGAFVRKRLLCQAIPPPDFALVEAGRKEEASLDRATLSNREVTERLTDTSTCAGCHALINPFGFALESFNELGALRSQELVFDEANNVVAKHLLDTSVEYPSLQTGKIVTLNNAQDLNQALVESQQFHACVAQRLITQAQLRPLATDASERCYAASIAEQLSEGVPVRDAWINVAVESVLTAASQTTVASDGGDQ